MEPSERWVWAISVKGADEPCSVDLLGRGDSPPATLTLCRVDSWTVMVDYFSGEVVEVFGGSLP
jgi:hypothetical protein